MDFTEIIRAISIKPYYQDESVVIYNADCRDILPLIPDKSVDLILTDPPYNISNGDDITRNWRPSNITKDFGEWDKGFNPIPFLKEAVRICNGDLVVFTSSYLFGTIHDYLYPQYNYCKYIVWEKSNPSPSIRKKTWRQSTELIIHAHNKDVVFLDQFRMRNVLHGDTCFAESLDHPTQKPLWLIRDLLVRISGNLVLDPFMGSGTTVRASKELGRKCIGIEISEKYCEIGAKRCSQTVLNLEIPQEEEVKQGNLI